MGDPARREIGSRDHALCSAIYSSLVRCVIVLIALHNQRRIFVGIENRKPVPNAQRHLRRSIVSEQFTKQIEEFFSASNSVRIPDNVQSIVEEAVVKTRDAYLKISDITKDGFKAFDDAATAAYAGTKTIRERVLLNLEANTKVAFDGAQSISRASTLPEVLRLQASYLQNQVVATSVQTKELCELSAKVVQQTIEAINSAASKTFEPLRNVA